jgi:type I restriction enzyme, S subunit
MTMKLGVQEEPAIYKVLREQSDATARHTRVGKLREFVVPRREKVHPQDALHLPYIGMEQVEAHTMRLLGTVEASSMKSSANRFFPGDVLYGRLRPYLNKVYLATFEGICSPEFIVMPRTAGLAPQYLRYRLNAHDFVAFARHLNAGDRPRVDFEQISDFTVALPPEYRQAQTVAYLDEQLSRLDVSVAALHRVQANLKRYRASVLKSACEGRLVPTEAELAREEGRNFETGAQLLQRILSERRSRLSGKAKYKEPIAPCVTEAHELPGGWTWATVEQLTFLVTSGSRGWSAFYADSGTLFIRAQDIKTDALQVDGVARVNVPEDAEGSRSSVGSRDILITITGANVTKSALVPALREPAFVSQHVALLKLTFEVTAAFVFNWIVSPANGRKVLESWAYGAGKPGLSLEQVRELRVALPPLTEQHRIVAEADRRLSLIRVAEAQVTTNLARAQRLRQSILQVAFGG